MSQGNRRPNKVDGVLQGYLDDLLVSATESSGPERYGNEPSEPVNSDKASERQPGQSQPLPSTPKASEPAASSSPMPEPLADSGSSEGSSGGELHAPGDTRAQPLQKVTEAMESSRLGYAEPPPVVLPRVLEVARAEPPVVVETPAVIPDTSVQQGTAVPDMEQALESQNLDAGISSPSMNWQSSGGVDCLIFMVCGLKLAIPLPMLGGVHKVSDRVTPLFGQAAWSLGVWQGDGNKLTIVDSATLMMPERQRSLQEEGFEFFIQLDRSPWALACQQICDTVKLREESIKWRGERSKRPWLAGTVIDEMCALIDVPGLLALLETQRSRRSSSPG